MNSKTVTMSRDLVEEVVSQLHDFITGDILNRLRDALEKDESNESYELWYNQAIESSNHLGFAGMSATDVIVYLGVENKELSEEIERLTKQLDNQNER
jgi:hypothetical protein